MPIDEADGKSTTEDAPKLTPEEQEAKDASDRKIADYAKLTTKEVNKLVRDIIENSVFTDRHIGAGGDMGMIFMGMLFLNDVQSKAFRDNPPGMIYAYYKDQMPRSCNGYPCFMGFNVISKDDAERVWKKVYDLDTAMKEMLSDDDSEPSEQATLFE